MRLTAVLLVAALGGCQTTNYLDYANAMARIAEAHASVQREQAQAMMTLAAHGGDQTTRTVAVLMLAMGAQSKPAVNVAPPINEPLEWVRVLAGPITAGLLGYFSYRQAIHLSDDNANVSIAGYGAMQGIAQSGFNAVGAFKPTPIDWSTFPATTRVNIRNEDGQVVVGGDGTMDNSNRPIAIVPPVVVTNPP